MRDQHFECSSMRWIARNRNSTQVSSSTGQACNSSRMSGSISYRRYQTTCSEQSVGLWTSYRQDSSKNCRQRQSAKGVRGHNLILRFVADVVLTLRRNVNKHSTCINWRQSLNFERLDFLGCHRIVESRIESGRYIRMHSNSHGLLLASASLSRRSL